jgi:hypothetical protein
MRHYLKFGIGVIAGCLLAAAMTAGIFTASAQTTQLAPNVTVTSVTSPTAVQIIGTNPGRKDIRICNVGTGVLWIWPGPLSPAVSAYELPALSSGTTVCFTPPDGSVGAGNSGQGNSWNAQAVSTTGPISVFEW